MHQKVHKPNFFILGAAKSGTTALYNFLKQHPEIFMSPVKEPCFFCSQFQIISNPIDYIDLFKGVASEKIIGEASHSNMSFPGAARSMSALFPEAKFVVLLRNPADRAFSLYKHMVYHGREWISTFEKALATEEERCVSEKFEKNCTRYYYNFLYFRSGLYSLQIKEFLQYYDRSRFLFFSFEQFQEDQLAVVGKIYDFLGVDTSFVPSVKKYNVKPNDIRYPAFHYFMTTHLDPFLQRLRLGASNKMTRLSLQYNRCGKKTIASATRSSLLARYQDDIFKTSQLTGLDLGRWINEK